MPYAIFSVPKQFISKIDTILKDDLVSRQSIVMRDAHALGIEKNVRFVLIEGSEKAIEKAREIFKGVGEEEKDKDRELVYSRFKLQEDNVDIGMGLLSQP